ncbi:acetyl-CoA hydrolase [Mycoplasmoides gallisepticum WI01_2001.043-13-2P]|uniref:Acetyl-CoA hydrolase n=1 Tax=Mycoplasmoides gallisepticum WI01_2001.043-13-2P TaxID=1159201 RepID=J3YT11_MYCGL|nr:acetyl-CoA hydrolase/transferase C-terminal domain-containing protein [Mycoplasmoides gallisepticum]AFP79011.1 acetyl-CoA hydrolase [Mycoplasmoides gallisepticum WI01_2001.043-13-2P]
MYFRTYLRKTKSSKKSNYTKLASLPFSSREYARNSILDWDLNKIIVPHSFFISDIERKINAKIDSEKGEKRVMFHPCHFSQAPKLFTEVIKPDTFITMVSPMDKFGFMSLGLSNDYASTLVKNLKNLIVEVNENVPYTYGSESVIHVSQVAAIVENNVPLLEMPDTEPKEEEIKIAETIAKMVPNGATIQMGAGGLPNLVCEKLKNHKDLGIHTEVLTKGMIHLIQAGAVTNKKKNINKGKSVYTFAMGDKEMYELLDRNPTLSSYPVDYVKDPSVIAKNDNVVSINSTIEIDLAGACNAKYLKGHQYSASGGQLDFVRGAYLSKNGKSIIALTSRTSNQKYSKIFPRLSGPVTTPRNDVHWVVTEYGAVNLKGLSSSERAKELISLAHPDFRAQLTEEAKKLNLL